MKISLVTDEISADPETAVELGVEWGIHDFELRGFGTARVPNFSAFQKRRIVELMEEFNGNIIAISPGLFKIPFPARQRERFPLRTFDAALYDRWQTAQDVLKYHVEELLPASIEYAVDIGARRVVIFSFERGRSEPAQVPEGVLEMLHSAAQLANAAGVQLVIEVEAGFWADTGNHTAKIIHTIGQPALRVNWDPGNAFHAGDNPFPTGYEAVQHFVGHVHYKDVHRNDLGEYHYVVDGDLDWPGQIAALQRDGYAGYISIESHMQPKVSSARALLHRLRRLMEASHRAA